MEKGGTTNGRVNRHHSMLVAADGQKDGSEAPRNSLAFEVGCNTHIGFDRQANEDAFWLMPDAFDRGRATRLMAVADGMGGHNGGGIASRFACEAMDSCYQKLALSNTRLSPAQLCRELTDSIFRIDRRLRLKARKTEATLDMGTTLSCLVLTDSHSIIGHVGDSRIYRWRSGRLSCLTLDHTFVQEMITEGEVDPETADKHPLRHLLTQAVGTAEPLEHVLARVDRLKSGDRFLLCTDGLHNWVPEEKIADVLALESHADRLASNLVDTALINKARDNVTALVVTVAGVGENDFARTE